MRSWIPPLKASDRIHISDGLVRTNMWQGKRVGQSVVNNREGFLFPDRRRGAPRARISGRVGGIGPRTGSELACEPLSGRVVSLIARWPVSKASWAPVYYAWSLCISTTRREPNSASLLLAASPRRGNLNLDPDTITGSRVYPQRSQCTQRSSSSIPHPQI